MVTPWKVLRETAGWSGYLPIDTRRYRLPDGSNADWDISGGAASVAILAFTDDDQVVLARQFRPGPERILDELPGGAVDDGESILDAAGRELLEETGYAGELAWAASSWLAAASRTERHVVVARHARFVAPSNNQPGEFCETVLMPLSAFRNHLRSGTDPERPTLPAGPRQRRRTGGRVSAT